MSNPRAVQILLDHIADGSVTNIDFAHNEIHEEESFTASFKADVGNGATIELLIVTPNTDIRAHFMYELDVEAETDIKLIEGVTATAGSAVAVYNRNRNSTKAATLVVTSAPTNVSADTTLIRDYHLGSGRSYGGGSRDTHEFILKKNTKYILRLKNETATANFMAVKLDWYERTNS